LRDGEVSAFGNKKFAALIFADWLDEHGDMRGELIRVHWALKKASWNDPARPKLQIRQRELLRALKARAKR